MPLEGFDRPRPAPRAPHQARNQPSPPDALSEKAGGIYTIDKSNTLWQVVGSGSNFEKPRAPALNVITNFSQPQQAKKVSAATRSVKQETLQERRRRQKDEGPKGRVNGLRAEEPVSGLSPSDRELVIGLTVPGPPSSGPRKPNVVTNLRRHKSRTPEIVITPADTKSGWQSPVQSQVRNRRKPTSSVYSRFPDGTHDPEAAPPVPPVQRRASVTSIETTSSISSWATEFSDEDTLSRGISRPESGQSQVGILTGNSADTFATKYRSQGWWNTIVSPFLDRSGTVKTFKSPGPEKSPLSADNPKSADWKIAKARVRRPSYVHSIWADLKGQTSASKNAGFFNDEKKDLTFSSHTGAHRGQMVASPGAISPESPEPETSRELEYSVPQYVEFVGNRKPVIRGDLGTGLAAEYFEAYFHDQNDPTPYFACENHVCEYGMGRAAWLEYRGAATIEGAADGSRGLEESGTKPELKLGGALDAPKALSQAAPETKSKASYPESAENQAPTALPYPDSKRDSTDIEDDGDEVPHVAQARTMQISKARSPAPPSVRGNASPAPRCFGGASSPKLSNVRSNFPADVSKPLPYPAASPQMPAVPSPGAMTPGLRADYGENRALPMVQPVAPMQPAQEPPSNVPNPYARYHSEQTTTALYTRELPRPLGSNPAEPRYFDPREQRGAAALEINDSHPRGYIAPQPRDAEQGQAAPAAKKSSKLGSILKALFHYGSRKQETMDKKKWQRKFWLILAGLLLLALGILLPVMLVALPRDDIPVQTAWLNISGYPPIPTGIATIIRPNAKAVDGCIQPSTLWSCALPKELQPSIVPNEPDQPNFRVEIRFQNGTNLTANSTFSKRAETGAQPVVEALRRNLLQVRDSFTSNLFSPSPAPPNQEDQDFLGNTTDNNTQPFSGEATPFFMSFLDAGNVDASSKVRKRQTISGGATNSSNSSNPFPNLADQIPPPDTNSDGTAAAANLYPLPTAQPLMLYNRGQVDEHYGFYTYFDRSIFLKSASLDNITAIGTVPDNENGGSEEDAATLRCTWAQTRFLVQIWTNTDGSAPLLNTTATSTGSAAEPTSTADSANDFAPPGSFPYPVTLTLDRHGGDLDQKSVYCYGMDDREHIIDSEKKLQLENRAFGGVPVNPAIGLFSQINVTLADGGPGGIDGGSGGCSCQWQNFDQGGGEGL